MVALSAGFSIRTMTPEDLDAVSILAGRLVRMHHAFDPDRFLHLQHPERGYAQYFASELARREVVLVVAERGGRVVGYAYGRLEPRSYNDLLDAHGKLHDVFVDEAARGAGVGEALVREITSRLAAKGAPRTVLATAAKNEGARRLFERLGFRATMIEMTRESV